MPKYTCQWCGKQVIVRKGQPPPANCPACGYAELAPVARRREVARGRRKRSAVLRLWPLVLLPVLAIFVGAPLAERLARMKFGGHRAIEEIVARARLFALLGGVLVGLALSAWGFRRRG